MDSEDGRHGWPLGTKMFAPHNSNLLMTVVTILVYILVVLLIISWLKTVPPRSIKHVNKELRLGTASSSDSSHRGTHFPCLGQELSKAPNLPSDHSDPMMCYDILWPHILEHINVHHRIKSAVFHPTFLTCGFYSVVLEIFSIHSTAGTVFPRDYRRLRQWRSLLAMVFQGSILQWFEKGGKHWQTQRDETVSQKSPPPQKKKDIMESHFFSKLVIWIP